MGWELTDKEIREAYEKEATKYPHSLGAPFYYGRMAVAKAAQKKLVEWLESNYMLIRGEPDAWAGIIMEISDWRDLCKSLGIKE